MTRPLTRSIAAVALAAAAISLLSSAPLAAANDPSGDALIPPTPEGWRYEKMEFPLSFAPDLALDGFEELRFAPGMFDPKSDTYWTYCFGIELAGEVEIDRAWLEDFLVKYYRGLCVAVSKGKRPLDPASITAKVAERPKADPPAPFAAAIELVNAFVTGKPLTLRLEIVVAETPKGGPTRLFAIASPRPDADGDPVWKTLRDLRDRFPPKRD